MFKKSMSNKYKDINVFFWVILKAMSEYGKKRVTTKPIPKLKSFDLSRLYQRIYKIKKNI